MSIFFNSSYDSELSSDEETLYYSDDERYLKQQQLAKKLLITGQDDDSSEESMSESEGSEDERETPKPSAFMKGGDASEDDDEDEDDDSEWSNDDSDSDSDSDVAPKGRSYFLKGDNNDSDSEDEDEKKIVKSAKDKYLDELASLTDTIENLSMVQEWVRLANEFDKLYRLSYKHNQYHISIPRSFIKAVAILEDAINSESNAGESAKKLNASESKSLNILKQKIKKEAKLYREEVEKYKQDPEAYEAIKDEETLIVGGDETENKELNVSLDNLFPIVQMVIESRGKKGVDQVENLKTLNELYDLSTSTYEKIILLNLIISLRYEIHNKEKFLPTQEWRNSAQDIEKLFDLLESDKSYVITETAPANDDLSKPPAPNADGKHLIVGSVTAFVERLADELTSHLLYLDPNSSEYISLLKDDSKLYTIIVRAQLYLSQIISNDDDLEADQLCRIIIKRIESIYYKPVKLIILSELNTWNALSISDNSNDKVQKITVSEAHDISNTLQTNKLIDSLCSHLYQHANGIQSSIYRKRAALMQSYYYSISNQFFRARDILHLTHVQTTIHTSEPGVQVLFNRAIVQLGLAAFRSGLSEEAQTILNEIVTNPNTRDLLGQSKIYFNNNNQSSATEVGPNEKGKYVPFHMHVNIELIDSVYYIASLFVELPYMALQSYQHFTPGAINAANIEAQTQSQNKKNVSRSFKRILEYNERQYFQGPAEESRDHVFDAYNKLVKFNWKAASKTLCDLKVWGMMPGVSIVNADGKSGTDLLNEVLIKQCKTVALKTWAYVNAGVIKNYAVRRLATRFEIDENDVCSIIGGLIHREEIRGYLKFNEDNSKSVVFNKKEDGMGGIVRGLTECVNSILERNEKLSVGGYQIRLKKKQLSS